MEETSDGSSSKEDELSLLSRRVNQLLKQRQRKFRNPKRSEDRKIRMNPPPDTKSLSPPLDTEDLKVLQDTKSQTTKTSSAMNITNKGTTKVIAQSFRRRSPKEVWQGKEEKSHGYMG